MQPTYDAVILGTGIAGLGTARGLLNRGKKVLLIGRKDVAGTASERAAGMLNPYLGIEPGNPLLPLALRAFAAFPAWVKELEKVSGLSAGYKKTGLLYLSRSPEETRFLKKQYSWQSKQSIKVRLLDSSFLKKKYPFLADHIEAGLFFPELGCVKPALFMKAFRAYIRKRGAQVHETIGMPKVQKNANGLCAVTAGGKKVTCRQVVNASGAWAPKNSVAVREKKVVPARGQIFILKSNLKISPIMHTLGDGYLVPWGGGVFLCGSTLEFAGYRPAVTRQGQKQVFGQLASIIPGLENARILDSWAGLRPMAAGKIPKIGPKTRKNDFFVTTGFFRSGILMGTYLGDLLAAGMTGPAWPKELQPFRG